MEALNDPKSLNELAELLARSEEDLRNGRIAPIEETFDALRKALEER